MGKQEFLQELSTLPTLVEKLRLIELRFPADKSAYKRLVHRLDHKTYDLGMDLSTDLEGEEELPEVTGMGIYLSLSFVVRHVAHFDDIVITEYLDNPVVQKAINESPIYLDFSSHQKNPEQHRENYKLLVGELSQIPELPKKLKPNQAFLSFYRFCGGKPKAGHVLSSLTAEQRTHPILLLDNSLYVYAGRHNLS